MSIAEEASSPLFRRRMDEKGAVAALGALALATRMRAFRLLVAAGSDGLPSGEIARLLEAPANTMSEHLQVLARAGIVTSERRSRSIIYRAEVGSALELMGYLGDLLGGRSGPTEGAGNPD